MHPDFQLSPGSRLFTVRAIHSHSPPRNTHFVKPQNEKKEQIDAEEDGQLGDRRGDELPSELATAGGRQQWFKVARRWLDDQRAEQAEPIPRDRAKRVKEAKRRMDEQLFIEKFAARPHWGLDMSYLQSWSEIERLYGQSAQDWQRVYRRLNSAGTFDGHLTDRLGISMRPKG